MSENTRPMREWHIPEDWNLHQPCHEKIKAHKNDQCSYWHNMYNIRVVSTAAGILHSTTCWLLESS